MAGELTQRKRIFIGLFACLLLPCMTLCQGINSDSLKQLLETDIHDTLRLSILDQLYDHYLDKDLAFSIELAEELLLTAERAEAQEYLCTSYIHLGTAYRKLNMAMDTVLSYFEEALACCESNDDNSCKGNAIRSIGSVYHRNGFPVEAIAHYQEALEIAEEESDTTSMIACLGNIASVMQRRLEYEKSLRYSHQALDLAKRVDHQLYIGMLTNNIANIYFNQEVYDTALVMYQQALEIKREQGSTLTTAVTLANIGGIHVEQGRYEQAQQYLDEAYTLATEQNYAFGLAVSLRFMASSAYRQQRYEETILLCRKGLTHLGKNGALQYARDFHQALSGSYEALNRPDSALVHLKTAQVINDSMFHAEKEMQLQQLEITYQVKQKEVENRLLKSEQSFTQQKLRTRTYLSIGLILALFLACGWGIALYRNNQAKKQMNSLLETEVAERTADLRIVNEQLQQANYELKSFNHIASHDLKQPIRTLGNYVGLISRRLPEDSKDELKDYFDIIHQSTQQLYTLIEDIASYSSLSNDDASSRANVDLEAVVSGIAHGLHTTIESRGAKVSYHGLPSIHSNASLIFIALKNLIENGIKFNESPTPEVSVTYQDSSTHHRITVADNGIGIAPEFQEQVFVMFKRLHNIEEYEGSGIGLAIVKLAIEKLGGQVEVDSQVGAGSTFRLVLPK